MKKSNEPTKTNEAMKKTMKKFLSMAALALVGAVMTGCSSDDLANNQQPANKNNVVTLTTTVNLGGDGTRALGADGKKTFATGDKIAVIYKDTDGNTQKAESEALTEGGGSSATFTVTLTDPKAEGAVRYIYPAAMATATVATSTAVTGDATINYAALASQDGTLTTLASKYDLAVFDGSLTADATLPASSTLTNRLAVIAYTIKDNTDTPIDLTGTITEMTLSDGTNSYTVTRSAATGPIYVAIQPTSGANIDYTATAGTSVYTKTSTNKTYAASNFYQQGLLVSNPEVLGDCFTVNGSGGKVAFSQGNLQATYNGSTWTWAFAEHQWDCIGNTSGNRKVYIYSPYVLMGDAESVTVDLFGWVGASSIWTGVNKFGITNSTADFETDGYGNVANENMKAEWNSENLTITNAGSYTWRTLTGGSGGEWEWILGPSSSSPDPGTNCRASGSTVNGTPNARWTKATINTDGTGVKGVILFPDGCRINAGSATTWGAINGNSTWGTECTIAQWQHLEKLGCVFLPAAGKRNGTSVDNVGSDGIYWSKTHAGSAMNAYYLIVYDAGLYPAGYGPRQNGYSVRLVHDAN